MAIQESDLALLNQNTFNPYSQYSAVSRAFGGSNSDRGRYQRELEDRRAQVNQGTSDQDLLNIINNQVNLQNLNPDQLLGRYATVYGAGDSDPANYVRQIYGDQDQLNQYAYDSFRTIVGREPTSQEFATVLPYFQGVNGRQTGSAYLSQFAEADKYSPENLSRRSGEYSGQVGGLVDSLLGRQASQNELDYYGRLLASNQITPYEVEQLLKGTQEYQTNQDTQFRQGLASELEGYDQSFFDKAKENVISRAARAGGGVGTSSALDFALTNLMGDIAEKRGQYLAGLSAQQYGGNKDAARADYLNTQNRYLSDRDYERAQSQREQDYFRSRSDENLDYLIQRDDYQRYLDSQKSGGSNPYGFLGGLAGAGIGGYAAGPQGALAGYQIGSGAGGAYDYLNRY